MLEKNNVGYSENRRDESVHSDLEFGALNNEKKKEIKLTRIFYFKPQASTENVVSKIVCPLVPQMCQKGVGISFKWW